MLQTEVYHTNVIYDRKTFIVLATDLLKRYMVNSWKITPKTDMKKVIGSQKNRVFHYTRPERIFKHKRSTLLGPFESYEENGVLLIRSMGPYLQHFIFFAN